MRYGLSAFVLLSGMAAAGSAFAGQIDATSYSVVNGGVNVHVSYAGSPTITNEYAGSGQLALTYHTLPGGADQVGQFWCTDLFDTLYTPAVYNVGLLSTNHGTAGPALSTQTLNEINALISHGDAMLASSFSNQVSSAIQLAIWSVEYGAGFSYVSDDSSVAGLVNTYVADVSGSSPVWAADPTKAVAQITTPTGLGLTADQALSYLTAVPEPTSIAILATGLVGLALRRRSAARSL